MLLAQSTRSSTPLLRRLVGFEKFSLNFHIFFKLEVNIAVMHSKWDVLLLLEIAFCFSLRAVYLTCITRVSPILLIKQAEYVTHHGSYLLLTGGRTQR